MKNMVLKRWKLLFSKIYLPNTFSPLNFKWALFFGEFYKMCNISLFINFYYFPHLHV